MMSKLINNFLKTELTAIPQFLHALLGDYYNNALCNGFTWLFIFWYVLHFCFDNGLNALLRRMRIKEYLRIRIRHSLWYLGFFSAAFMYTGAALFQNQIDLLGFRKLRLAEHPNISTDLVLGYLMLLSFYLHNVIWEICVTNSKTLAVSYVLLSISILVAYTIRVLELVFTLTAFISITQIAIESTRLIFSVTSLKNRITEIIVVMFFMLSTCSFALSYMIGVPLVFLIPLYRRLLTRSSVPILVVTMTLWYLNELHNSITFKCLKHWLFHTKEERELTGCEIGIIECSLFPPRDDIAYHVQQVRKDIEKRQTKLITKRKSKSGNVVIQTLKCMMALKKKLNAKRRSRTPSPEDILNEKSDDSNSIESDKSKSADESEEVSFNEDEFIEQLLLQNDSEANTKLENDSADSIVLQEDLENVATVGNEVEEIDSAKQKKDL